MALTRRPSIVISFASTTAAMTAEKHLLGQGLPGRIIPLPREVSAGCGLSWKASPSDEEALVAALREADIPFDAVHHLTI